jgi:hypothetical protein
MKVIDANSNYWRWSSSDHQRVCIEPLVINCSSLLHWTANKDDEMEVIAILNHWLVVKQPSKPPISMSALAMIKRSSPLNFCKPTWNVHHRRIILRPCCYHIVFPARWHSKLSVLAYIIASCELPLITMAITVDIPPPRAKTSGDRGLQTSRHGGTGPLIPSSLHRCGQHPDLLD